MCLTQLCSGIIPGLFLRRHSVPREHKVPGSILGPPPHMQSKCCPADPIYGLFMPHWCCWPSLQRLFTKPITEIAGIGQTHSGEVRQGLHIRNEGMGTSSSPTARHFIRLALSVILCPVPKREHGTKESSFQHLQCVGGREEHRG